MPAKSQWNFGELFPPEQSRQVLSVSELTTQIKRLLEKQVGTLWVSGEITNFRAQASGHIYFTLKDAGSQLSCVLFSRESVSHRELLADGQKVLLQGDVTVYEARGQYQLIVRGVELQGVGALQLAFEKLKAKLAAAGLFAPERKRPLPAYPQRIGVVTSPTGAAIRDVLHVVQRRHPGLEIILAPCRVQGDGAAGEIAEAIRQLNAWSALPEGLRLDLILLTRGGGSLEDLWAFNEEIVARAIAASAIPIVSAVGHEIDFTISDFVADWRAATPSAAAEIITEGVFARRAFVAEAAPRLRQIAAQRLARWMESFEHAAHRLALAHPRRRVEEQTQRLDELHVQLHRRARTRLREQSVTWQHLATRLVRLRPALRLQQWRELLDRQSRRLPELAGARLRELHSAWQTASTRLRLLGPEQVLARGYSITSDAATGKILREATQIKRGQRLATRLKSGTVRSVVE